MRSPGLVNVASASASTCMENVRKLGPTLQLSPVTLMEKPFLREQQAYSDSESTAALESTYVEFERREFPAPISNVWAVTADSAGLGWLHNARW